MSDDTESPFAATPHDSRHRSSRQRAPGVNPLFIALAIGGVLAVTGAIGWFAFGTSAAPKGGQKADATGKQPVAPATAIMKGKGTPTVVPPATKDRTEKPSATFHEAMDEAAGLAEQLDKDEPEKTRKALALLTATERPFAEQCVAQPQFLRLPDARASALKYGLVDFVARFSRSEARRSEHFAGVARTLWEPKTGATGIVEMMNRWGLIDGFTQAVIVSATANDWPTSRLTPEARNAILDLGGREWLQRK